MIWLLPDVKLVGFTLIFELNLNQTNAQIAEETIPPVFTLKWRMGVDAVIVILILYN